MIDPAEEPRREEIVPVCAIGASAGGIPALGRLFSTLRPDLGLAYVVIADVPPDRPAGLAGILAARTPMAVRTVADPAPIEPDTVYVVPPGRELVIEAGRVAARPVEKTRGLRVPIDVFFRSAASAVGDGLAIILGGLGTDGSLGVRAIKEAGGVVLVQSPEEAEDGEMPRSAIATGAADLVLPVRAIAERIAAVAEAKRAAPPIDADADADAATAAAALRRIGSRMRARTGHDVASYDAATVARRIGRRMQVAGHADLAAYEDHLRASPEETQALFTDLLNPATMFFRDPAAFEALGRAAIRAIVERHDAEEGLRAWVVGCATGEEAYSVAMLLLEEQDRQARSFPLQIFATDLDAAALETAREGRYPRSIEADVPEERLERFFAGTPASYHVGGRLREAVLFANHSVARDPPFTRMDLVSCRNVLSAMGLPLRKQVLSRLHQALKPGGHLFLGATESTEPRPDLFAPVAPAEGIHAARPLSVSQKGQLVRLSTQAPDRALGAARAPSRLEGAPSPERLHASILEGSALPSVLVDEERRVLHLSTAAGRFMRPSAGPLPTELPGLVRPELRAGLADALHRALAENLPTLTHPAAVEIDGERRRVALHVAPTTGPWALVAFLDGGPRPGRRARDARGAAAPHGAPSPGERAPRDEPRGARGGGPGPAGRERGAAVAPRGVSLGPPRSSGPRRRSCSPWARSCAR